MKRSLSVCFIVKNEENVLERILKQTKEFSEEIVVVDTGSNDKTKEIAKKYTDKVYDFHWCDDFSKARNFAFSKGTSDYLMWLDADDFIFPNDIEKIKKLKHEDFDVAFFQYVSGYDENFNPTFLFERERVVRRDMNFKWVEPVHEVIVPFGKIIHKNIKIYHFQNEKQERSGRNLKIYEKKIADGEKLSTRALFYYARELYFNNFFDDAIDKFNEFFERKDAWIENKIEACLNLSCCYYAKNDKQNALKILFSSFSFDLPRAEILCEIGKVYSDNDLEKSIFYYELALKCKPNTRKGAFVSPDFYNFIPLIELCALYYQLGNTKKAYKCHKRAKKIKPNHPAILFNDKFFKELGFYE